MAVRRDVVVGVTAGIVGAVGFAAQFQERAAVPLLADAGRSLPSAVAMAMVAPRVVVILRVNSQFTPENQDLSYSSLDLRP